jgi:tight adherence protein C
MQLGMSRADAFRGLAERSTVPELKSFVLSMVQADIFGISVAKVLQVQAKEMRIKRRQRAEERAQKVPVKILFPLLFCIFPALFIVLLGPAALRIYESLFLTR